MYRGIFITGIFALSGGGIFDFQNGNSRWPCVPPPVTPLHFSHLNLSCV